MGTFMGHLLPGLALTFLGLWHTINTTRAFFLNGPHKFTIKFSHRLKSPLLKLQHLEPVLILSFSVFAILAQVLDSKSLRFSFELDSIEHATIFLQLIVFISYTLFTELAQLSENMLEVSGVLVALVFGQELFLLHYHSTDHMGLEGHYHWLMQITVCISFLAALCVTMCPNSFPAALILSMSIILQGCWFVNMGFVLWVPSLVPRGCLDRPPMDHKNGIAGGAVACGTREADLRARALANLQFCWLLSSISIFVASICICFARRFVLRKELTEYERVSSAGEKDPLATVGFKQIQL